MEWIGILVAILLLIIYMKTKAQWFNGNGVLLAETLLIINLKLCIKKSN